MTTETLKKCPRCASGVPVEAQVCAHCRSRLPLVGAGWWEASDGIMYPPHLHPDFPRNMPPVERKPTSLTVKVLIVLGTLAMLGLIVAGANDEEEAGDGTRFVRYEVSGSASEASLTYSDANGSTSQRSDVDVPTHLSFTVAEGEFLYVSAQNSDESGSISCRITADGEVVDEATSFGGFTIATCSGEA